MAQRLHVVTGHLQASQTRTAMARPPITTHVLDTTLGQPARRVPIELAYLNPKSNSWMILGSGSTNDDGRCVNLVSLEQLKPGTYRMHFDTKTYFASQNNFNPFYPYVDVVFNLEDTSQHFHIPLLLSPCSYTTYRGS